MTLNELNMRNKPVEFRVEEVDNGFLIYTKGLDQGCKGEIYVAVSAEEVAQIAGSLCSGQDPATKARQRANWTPKPVEPPYKQVIRNCNEKDPTLT
jgi:hypothetical protein